MEVGNNGVELNNADSPFFTPLFQRNVKRFCLNVAEGKFSAFSKDATLKMHTVPRCLASVFSFFATYPVTFCGSVLVPLFRRAVDPVKSFIKS